MVQRSNKRVRGIITILFYGCLWGLLEMTLGGYLHAVHYPGKGQIMTSIAYIILAAYVIRHKKFWHPLVIGCIAAGFKGFNVFIYGVPLLSQGIVNPAISIIMESMIVSGITFIVLKAVTLKPVKDLLNKLPFKY